MSNYNSGAYYGSFKYDAGFNLEGLSPAELDIYIDQGDSYTKDLTVTDENGIAINLSGLSTQSTLHRYYGSGTNFELLTTITDGPLGKIRLTMTATETAKLKNPRYVYEVKLFDTYSKTRVVFGQALISQMV